MRRTGWFGMPWRQHRLAAPRRHVFRSVVSGLFVVAGVFLWGAAGAAAATGPVLGGSVSNGTSLSGAAYVAVSGSYAYTTTFYPGTLTVADISNPAAPHVVGQSPYAASLLNGSAVAVAGNYAYVVSQNRNQANGTNSNDDGTGNSLTILDISVPAAPTIVGTLHDSNLLFGAHGVVVSGSYVYVAAQGCLSQQPCPNGSVGNSFVVIDVSTPSHPAIVASLRNASLPAQWAGSGALLHACGIAVSGQYAYVTASYANRLTIIDISDPLHPAIVGSLLNSSQLPLPVDVAVAGGYAYVVNELTSNGRVTVVDVRNPVLPQPVGSVAAAALNGAYRIRVRNNFAYVAATYSPSMSVLDISDPANPRLAGSFSNNSLLNRTVGIDLDPTSQYAISISPFLSSELRIIFPPYPLLPGGPSNTGTLTTIVLDPLPISVTLGSTPPSTTTATTALFTFSTNDAVSTVRCQLDGAPLGLCASPTSQSYGALASGQHTFTVQAIDAAGNTATTTYTWTVTAQQGVIPPTTAVLDNFNRANGPVGSNWALIKSSGFTGMNVSGNTAVDASTTVYAFNYWNAASFGPDAEAYVTVANYSGDTVRVGARVTGGTNYSGYFVSVSATGAWSIIRIDNGGSPVTLASGATQQISTGDRIAIRIIGSVVTALHYTAGGGWGQVLSYDTASDAVRYTAAGRLALEFRAGAFDDFGGGSITTLANTSVPTVSGTVAVGQQLQASPGSWTGSPAPSFTYQWQDCDSGGNNCVPIQGATNASYTIQGSDGGLTLEVVVTASNSAGTSQASSAPTAPAAQAPANTSVPVLSGTVAVGQQLQASAGGWTGSPAPSFSYQWQDCASDGGNCVSIQGATNTSYTIQGSDAGFALEALVTASNSAGTIPASSAPTATVPLPASAPVNTQLPVLSGTVAVGQQLQASTGSWNGSPAPTFTYQWQDCDSGGNNCVPIQGATNASYTIQGSDVGFTLEAAVTASNSSGSSQASSAPTPVVPPAASAPVMTLPPSVSGTVAVGQQLQASTGSWTGAPAPSFSYQWQDCDSNGNNCVPVQAATNASYTIQGSDVGFTLEVVVTASNSAGTGLASSPPTSLVPPPSSAPMNTQLPLLSGSAVQGQTVSVAQGAWSGSPVPTVSDQWQRCDSGGANCVDIAGATGLSYVLAAADVGSTVRVNETATNSAGSSSAATAASAVVTAPSAAPMNTQLPLLSGSAVQGQTVSVAQGAWSGSPVPTVSDQWQRCDSGGANCVDIAGATGLSYVLAAADVGSTVRVNETATNSAGSSSAATAASAVVSAPSSAPVMTLPPSVSGTVAVGQQLQASTGSWTGAPAPSFSYQWQDCDSNGNNCVPVQAATNASYTIQGSDVGFTLEVVVTASNSAGTGLASSPPTSLVPPPSSAPMNTQLPLLSGSAVQGQTVSVAQGAWSGSPVPTVSDQWQRCDSGGANCVDIAGATGLSYVLAAADVGSTVRVNETATNSAGSSSAATAASAVVTAPSAAPMNTQLPLLSGSAVQGQTVSVAQGAWSGSPVPTVSDQWQRCDSGGANCVDIAGATGLSYVLAAADVGSTVRVNETATNSAGSSSAATAASAVVSAGLAPTTPVLDNFNRANGPVGTGWSLIKPTGFAVMNIASSAAVDSSGTAFAWNYWKTASFGPNAEAYVTIQSYGASDVIRIGARVTGGGTTSPSGYYVAVSATGVWSILRIDKGGSPVTLASGVTQPLAAGDKLAIRIVGSLVSALHYTTTGWTQVLSYDTSHDSIRYTAAGSLALEFLSSRLDDFGGGTIP